MYKLASLMLSELGRANDTCRGNRAISSLAKHTCSRPDKTNARQLKKHLEINKNTVKKVADRCAKKCTATLPVSHIFPQINKRPKISPLNTKIKQVNRQFWETKKCLN